MNEDIKRVITKIIDQQFIELNRINDGIEEEEESDFSKNYKDRAVGRLEGLALAIGYVVGGVSNED